MHPEIYKQVRAELDEKIVHPYLREHNLEKLAFNQILDIINIENTSELSYLSNCLNESLRIEPPVNMTSTLTFTEDVKL